MSKAKEIGKFIYIEPNDLYGDKPSNAIPQPYEDYSMAVDLQVEIPSRDSCGDPNFKKTLYFSSDNGTISFFGGSGGGDGKQGYLTTNFTDISPMNVGKGNRETLGISSINITYDSWFFPVVTINFVDVRGASLMMPQEYAYRTEVSNNTKDITQLEGGSFFKALFSFPYPLFKLTVKGFYGRAAVYNLAVKDFKASFNSQTGNFECVAQFIGYMFGVYTDIPMTYLAVAPYIDRGLGQKYGSKWLQSNFMYHDECNGVETPSMRMMTYPEFKLAIFSANTQLDKVVSSTKIALDMNDVRKKKTALNEIKYTFSNLGFECTKSENDPNDYLYYKIVGGSEKISDLAKEVIILKQKVEKYIDADFSKDDSGSLDKTLKPLFDLIEEDGNKKSLKCRSAESRDNGLYSSSAVTEVMGEMNDSAKNNFLVSIKSVLTNKKVAYIINFSLCTNFVEYLDRQDREYEKKSRNFEVALQQERLKALESVLGFKPSIKNIFDMTFAHMETFVKEYYQMLNNIKTQMNAHSRAPQKFGFREDKDTDFRIIGPDNPSTSTKPSDKQVPPFPLFIKEVIEDDGTKINRVVGPWEFDDRNLDMEEMKFVIKLLNAGKYFSEEAMRVNEQIENYKDAQGSILPDVDKIVPTTLYDFANPVISPYQSVLLSGDKDSDKAYQIILTFLLRWYYFSITFNGTIKDEKGHLEDKGLNKSLQEYFAQMEAFNLNKVLPKITESIRSIVLNNDNIDGFINNERVDFRNYITIGSNNTSFSNDGKILRYDWLWKRGNNGKEYAILPVGEFDLNTIKTDLTNSTYLDSNKYVILSGGTFSPRLNTNNFKIDSNGNFFDETITAIKNADDGVGDVKDKIIESIKENSIFTQAKKKEDPYIHNIFTNGETDNFASHTSGGFGMISQPNIEKPKTISLNEYLENKNVKNLGLVGDGTCVDGNSSNSVFNNDVFNLQVDDLSKAYLFVMSLPLRTSIFDEGKHIINNGTTLKSMLLREGAYYWRKEFMEKSGNVDPIILDDAHKNAPSTSLYIVKSNTGKNTLSFVNKNDNSKSYTHFVEYAVTDGRKEAIKDYFVKWAESDFKKILHYQKAGIKPDSNVNYYIEDPDYFNLIFDVLTDFETVIDEAPTLSQKSGSVVSTTNMARKEDLNQAYKSFVKKLNELYKDDSEDVALLTTETNLAQSTDIINDKDLMLSTYLVLKSLYDKWFCGMDKETWFLESDKSDFKNFKYIDSYYNNIGHKLVPNLNNTLDLVNTYIPAGDPMTIQTSTEYSIKSMHEFLSDSCEKIGVYFKSLPLMYGLDPTDVKKIDTMFDAIPFSKYTNGSGLNDGQTYLCMYAYKPSEHLDIRDDSNQYDYLDDSFDICDINGEKSNTLPASLYEVGKNSIPAFGVTYAKQNQSYFKNISVSMENPMQTEASIATTMALASKAGDEPRNMTLYGQDLYRVYSNYSYTCSVDMMGNSQVVPMMYFQLNNIPMFRGAYMITKVEHNITAGNMETKFTGVRQNKSAVPLIVGGAILFDNEGNQMTEFREGSVSGAFTELSASAMLEKFKANGGRFSCDDAVLQMYVDMETTLGSGHDASGNTHWIAMDRTVGPGNCAGFVRRYIEAGGISTNGRPSVASGYIDWLPKIGFKEYHLIPSGKTKTEIQEVSKEVCQRGDICVMHHTKNSVDYGHICMWNDLSGNWVSDFKQRSAWPYEETSTEDMHFFRFGDLDEGMAKRIITPDLKAPF